RLVRGFPDLLVLECDGTDVVETWRAAGEAVAHARARKGPVLLHAHCTRPYSHSMSDDESAYRTEEERAEQEARDPIRRLRALLVEDGIAAEEELDRLEEEIAREVSDAADEALASPQPSGDT